MTFVLLDRFGMNAEEEKLAFKHVAANSVSLLSMSEFLQWISEKQFYYMNEIGK